MTMAILGLLAWKAVRHLTQPGGQPSSSQPSRQPGAAPTQIPQSAPGTPPAPSGSGGGLGSLLTGGLGGLLAGGAAGGALSGGLGDLLNQLQQGGQSDAANSWVGKGPNKPISPGDLAGALGADQIDQLSKESGMSRDDLLSGLSQYLPKVVDHLTPDGRLPTENELSGRI